jgi:hypothetical protein
MSDKPAAAAAGSGLVRVIYRSHSLLPDAPRAAKTGVTDILVVARRKNTQTGVTGVLLFDGMHFMQALEGARDEVEQVYERIARDLRHEDIELLECRPIAERGYRDFPMAYVEGPATERTNLRRLLASLAAQVGSRAGDELPAA